MVEDFFDMDFVILESTKTDDGMGSWTLSWSEKANSNYKGHLRILRADERIQDAKQTYTATHKHWYPVNVTLLKENRIKCLSEPFKDKEFEIIPIKNVWGNHKVAEASIIE